MKTVSARWGSTLNKRVWLCRLALLSVCGCLLQIAGTGCDYSVFTSGVGNAILVNSMVELLTGLAT